MTIREIDGDDLRAVYYWDEANPVSRIWPLTLDEYLAKVTAANWLHYGIYRANALVACLSVEAHAPLSWEIHVSSARRSIKPSELRRAILALKKGAIESGVKELFALVPNVHKAARRLCADCGLQLTAIIPTGDAFNGSPVSLLKYSYVQAEATATAVPADEHLPMASTAGNGRRAGVARHESHQ